MQQKDVPWRVTDVLLLPQALLTTLEQRLDQMAANLGASSLVADWEVCGSYAFGCAEAHSDIDIQWAAHDWTEMEMVGHLMYGTQDGVLRFLEERDAISNDLKISIDVVLTNPDNKSYNICYSLRERKLYNRNPDQVISTRRRWDAGLKKWYDTPRLARTTLFPPE
jgi:predicted nucleotidyltransferase